jgi:polar amino acid transport system substrate-binding protein
MSTYLWRMLMPLIVLLACSSVRAQTPATATQTPSVQKMLTVGVKVAPPFVIEDHGHYSGLAIDLWQEVAADHGWKYSYQNYDLDGLLDAVSEGKVDVGVGAITATAAREKRMDFSHLLTSSGLGIAVRNDQTAGWLAVVQALFSTAFLRVIGTLSLLLLLIGLLMWMFERKHNPEQFGGTRGQGIFSGFWWAMVTMTTVGYGDTAPRTVPGRLVGMVWMLTALIIVSFFTASITSALTVGQLSQRVRNADDLGSMRVASLADSTSATWLTGRGIDYRHAQNIDQALGELAAGRTDAVVYDIPLMRYEIRRHYRDQLQVLPLVLVRQDYAFALPSGSPLREQIDTSLLRRINAPDWPQRVNKAFGKTGK